MNDFSSNPNTYENRRTGRWPTLVLCLLAFLGAGLCIYRIYAQGVSTRNATPATRAPASGKPFLAKFTDVAAEAGLSMRFASGNEKSKKYIIEANGTGVAFIDYDNDG